jgi:hypothetical protein
LEDIAFLLSKTWFVVLGSLDMILRHWVGELLYRLFFLEDEKMRKLLILLLLLGVTGSALATTDWSYITTNRDWFNPDNWDDSSATQPVPQPIPTATTEVRTHASYACPYAYSAIIAAGSPYNPLELPAVASVINIGGNAQSYSAQLPRGQLTINSGVLTVGNGIRVGGSSSSIRSGELYVNGGIINASTTYLAVGYGHATNGGTTGWMYMTNGTVNVNEFDIIRVPGVTTPVNGYAYISGGTINANDLRIKPFGGAGTALLDISGSGKIIITDPTGAIATKIYGYIDNGWIKTNGVPWVLYDNVSWDGTKTTIIPEPATLCLLGLGALSLIRRKR